MEFVIIICCLFTAVAFAVIAHTVLDTHRLLKADAEWKKSLILMSADDIQAKNQKPQQPNHVGPPTHYIENEL